MKTPKLWRYKNIFSYSLYPFSIIYNFFRKCHIFFSKKYVSKKLNIICIGNLTAGGSGKTPTAIEIAKIFNKKNIKFAFLSKGYKGKIKKFTKVDNNKHTFLEVGDEPLLLSQYGDTFICKSRKEAIKILEKEYNYNVIVMDDGFQNPSIHKNKNIIIIDGEYGIGNGFLLPAGPLREKTKDALKRIDYVLIVGNDKQNLQKYFEENNIKVFRANIKEINTNNNISSNYIAFSGIGRPEKFFDSLKKAKYNVVEKIVFEDHHIYTKYDLEKIIEISKQKNAKIITTSKDWIKLSKEYKEKIEVLKIEIIFINNDFENSII